MRVYQTIVNSSMSMCLCYGSRHGQYVFTLQMLFADRNCNMNVNNLTCYLTQISYL